MKNSGIGTVLRASMAASVFVAIGAFHAWSHTRVVTAGYQLARIESEHRQLANEKEKLRLEVATLRGPGRLEQFARTKLGMAPPALGSVVSVGVGGRVLGRLPGPAEPFFKPTVVAARTASASR